MMKILEAWAKVEYEFLETYVPNHAASNKYECNQELDNRRFFSFEFLCVSTHVTNYGLQGNLEMKLAKILKVWTNVRAQFPKFSASNFLTANIDERNTFKLEIRKLKMRI